MTSLHQSGTGPVRHLAELHKLQPLVSDLALLPVGWGSAGKGPMLSSWQRHPGHTIAELNAWAGIRSVGARTGLHTGPLLAFDFDGETTLGLGLYPWTVTTWQVHRDNDPFRLKVLFRPTPEQLALFPVQAAGTIEFQGKTLTQPGADDRKGEALEVFFDGGRQVILLGEHPSSGGNYFWPEGLGPEALSAPPDQWLEHAIHIAEQTSHRIRMPRKASTSRSGTRRLDPCPICGRHSGPGGSELWCEETTDGLILCMPGSTFSAEQKHGALRIGQVIDGYALVARSPIGEGDVLTFKQHQERSSPRQQRHNRIQSLSHLVAAFS